MSEHKKIMEKIGQIQDCLESVDQKVKEAKHLLSELYLLELRGDD